MSYIPRLAGLAAGYQESKIAQYRQAYGTPVDAALLRIFRPFHAQSEGFLTGDEAARMIGIAKSVSERDSKAAADWYAAQIPLKHTQADDPPEKGKAIFAKGVPQSGTPPCQSCHGREGEGTTLAPRIAGQHAPYLLTQLSRFRKHGDSQSPMTKIAQSLAISDAEAVAQYLESR